MDAEFKHIFLPGDPRLPVLLLLHGTGGDETDLLDLGRSANPGAAILSVRGMVLENEMPRFFRRLSEGVFDLDDLHFRTNELAEFILSARKKYEIGNRPIIALGYSNGANIAASMLFSRPEILQGAILVRAMVPFEPETMPDLTRKKILMLSGLMDPIASPEKATRLSDILKRANAMVTFNMKASGHGIVQSDLTDIAVWLNARNSK